MENAETPLVNRGGIWYLRVSKKGRDFRKSLKTSDIEVARERADWLSKEVFDEDPEALSPKRLLASLRAGPNMRPMFVYFVRGDAGGLVKIGQSVNPKARARSMQTGSGTKLTVLAAFRAKPYAEAALHKRFAADRAHGEWFKLSNRLRRFIAMVNAG